MNHDKYYCVVELWDSELGGHVYVFWAHLLASAVMSALALLVALQILLQYFWQRRLTDSSDGTTNHWMLFLTWH